MIALARVLQLLFITLIGFISSIEKEMGGFAWGRDSIYGQRYDDGVVDDEDDDDDDDGDEDDDDDDDGDCDGVVVDEDEVDS